MQSFCYCCLVLTKIRMSRQILVKVPHIKFPENTFSCSRVLHAERRTNMTKLTCAILQLLVANATEIRLGIEILTTCKIWYKKQQLLC